MVNDHRVAENSKEIRQDDHAVVRRLNGHVLEARQVEPQVSLVVNYLAVVNIAPIVGERRFHFRGQRDEWPGPREMWRCLARKLDELLRLFGAQLAVD